MKTLRDFRCTSCHTETERYIDAYFTEFQCECGGVSRRIIGMPRIGLEGISGAFPGAHHRWAQIREDNAKMKAKRRFDNEGTT